MIGTIHLVLGPICSGKSHYISSKFSCEEQVVVRIGKFLRESIGLSAMAKDPSPNVCMVTEDWVRKHVSGAMYCARELKRDVVFDGYPRSVEQVEFLSNLIYPLCNVWGVNPKVLVHELSVKRETVEGRILARASGNKEMAAFDRMRIDASFEGVEKIQTQIRRCFPGSSVVVIDHN